MCVAFSDRDLLCYIFSEMKDLDFLSFEDMHAFRSELSRAISSDGEKNPHHQYVYIEPLDGDLTKVASGGVLQRVAGGLRRWGDFEGNYALAMEKRYRDRVVTDALAEALAVLRTRKLAEAGAVG